LDTAKLSTSKPSHKFFESYLDNDLEDFYNYLKNLLSSIVDENILNISSEELLAFSKETGAPTQLGKHYNIFSFEHEGIQNLQKAIRSMMSEACEYYGIDSDTKFYLNGWFNLDPKTQGLSGVSPLKNEAFFHDHMGGQGSPVFHGYYCINAEPSKTFYNIDKSGQIFENINKNNRAILSETGHPHGRDDWFEEKPRVTIAYDVTPNFFGGNWIAL
jgi:hypothetical protein